jgi:hypothetical protein
MMMGGSAYTWDYLYNWANIRPSCGKIIWGLETQAEAVSMAAGEVKQAVAEAEAAAVAGTTERLAGQLRSASILQAVRPAIELKCPSGLSSQLNQTLFYMISE